MACPGTPQDQSTAGSARSEAGEAPKAAERVEVDLFAFGRVLGQIAPCGCTSMPLGGLQYAFGYIEAESTAGARLILEPGSLLYPDLDHPEAPTDAAGWAQAEQRAQVLHARFGALGDDLVSGLGPSDFVRAEGGPDGDPADMPLPRVLANTAKAHPAVSKQLVRSLGHGVEAVVTAVADPSLEGPPEGFPELVDPVEAAKAALAAAPDAEISVVIAIGGRAFAEEMARALPVDLVLMGGPVPEVKIQQEGRPMARIGDTYLVQPGDRLQTVTHLTLRLDADAPERAAAQSWTLADPPEAIEAQIELLRARIERFEADPSADPSFIAKNKAQLAALEASKGTEDPKAAALAVFSQVPVTCKGAADATAKQALNGYDAWVAEENKRRFAGVRTPEPPAGAPTYVGMEACADCHGEAVEHWKGTVHAGAYETLEKANKQFDLTCVGCHVTGFRQPGGAEVVETRGLVDVQCEQCHGPGSAHAESPDTDNIAREVPESVCKGCHTPEHSDTFEYRAYLRDALGVGHGEEARAALGEGPTAAQLRAEALAKAGGSCAKM